MFYLHFGVCTRHEKHINRERSPCGKVQGAAYVLQQGISSAFPKFSINTKKYILYRETIFKDVVIPWSQTQFGDKRWTFQQDSAPAHRAKASVE